MRECETVTFTNSCMIADGDRVLALDRLADDCPGGRTAVGATR